MTSNTDIIVRRKIIGVRIIIMSIADPCSLLALMHIIFLIRGLYVCDSRDTSIAATPQITLKLVQMLAYIYIYIYII